MKELIKTRCRAIAKMTARCTLYRL